MSGEGLKRLCRNLKSKTILVELEVDPTVPDTDDGFFWCTHTMNCLGPDGKLADRESCRPGRACFERP